MNNIFKFILVSLSCLVVCSSCQNTKSSMQPENYEIIPCSEACYYSTELHTYFELDGEFSVYSNHLLSDILSSKKIPLSSVVPNSFGPKEYDDLEARSCFGHLAFFDSKNNLKYVIGLCFYNYVFTIFDGKDCKIQNSRIVPASGCDFKISEVRQNKDLFIKIVQMFEQKEYFTLDKDDSFIVVCYPDIKPIPNNKNKVQDLKRSGDAK